MPRRPSAQKAKVTRTRHTEAQATLPNASPARIIQRDTKFPSWTTRRALPHWISCRFGEDQWPDPQLASRPDVDDDRQLDRAHRTGQSRHLATGQGRFRLWRR